MTPLEMVVRIGVVQAELTQHRHHAVEKAAALIERTAKDAIGTYKFGWPALAPSTIAKKGADTPLLETGEMRDSIEHVVEHRGRESDADIGTNSKIAVWQTEGTSTIPPRPFMEPAAKAVEDRIHQMFHGIVSESFGHR